MPEYLTPGVYLEETSFRSRSIEGVPTSTFGIAGLTRFGPVAYQLTAPANRALAMVPTPPLITSFTEFERVFGGLEEVGSDDDRTNYVGHCVRAFFDNGGRRVYVSRVFPFATMQNGTDIDLANGTDPFARLPISGQAAAVWRARWPGAAGSAITVAVRLARSKNVVVGGKLVGVRPGALLESFATAIPVDRDPSNPTAPVPGNLLLVREENGRLTVGPANGGAGAGQIPPIAAHLTVSVTVTMGDTRNDTYVGLELGAEHRRFIGNALSSGDPKLPYRPLDDAALVWLDLTPAGNAGRISAADLLVALTTAPPAPQQPPGAPAATPPRASDPRYLVGGTDGITLSPDALRGEAADPDNSERAGTGLGALQEIEDISIVAAPDSARFADVTAGRTAVEHLIGHAERMRYRIAIVDPPKDLSITGIRQFRAQFDTEYAALYYPWMEILNPLAKNDPGAPPATLQLPPSGFAAGIYARNDITRGVHKAPANEVIRGISKFKQNITFDRQSVLNPEGINALRYFPGRSNRVWGARTMSSDPEWKYVNVRRLFIYLERSIDRSTQWAVFEPNNEQLWASIRQTITDFLLATWRTGALMGTKPEEAFFVRCDRTTMTQNDLDNGRLVCQIGVAPTYPAEFVIFRIGQWTLDALQS